MRAEPLDAKIDDALAVLAAHQLDGLVTATTLLERLRSLPDGERVVDLRIERLGTHQKCPREVRKSPSSSCPRGARSAAAAHGLAVAGTVAGADHGDVAAGAAVDELAGLAPVGLDAVVSGAALDVTPS